MPTLTVNGQPLHYRDEGRGPPLLLLHANPGDSRDYDAVAGPLAKSYRVLRLDWPGYGQSAMPAQPETMGVLDFYQALGEFLDGLDLPPALFIGNSIGGNAIVRLALDVPERVLGMVLISPGGFTPHNFISIGFCKFQGSRFSLSPRRFAGLYLKHRTPTTEAMLERASSEQATPERLALNRAMWRSFARSENDLRQSAGGIKAPTLLLFGEQDMAIRAKKDGKVAMQCIPHAQFAAMPCGHVSFAEIPDLFLAEVEPFLAACTRPE